MDIQLGCYGLCVEFYGVFLVAINFCCLSDAESRTKKTFNRILVGILNLLASSGFVLEGSSKFHS
ncbi:hypothetical protein Lal_00033649 [Lupinus albus]|nr:hypothetical protein Lal_00033649 [Lupinus albus]